MTPKLVKSCQCLKKECGHQIDQSLKSLDAKKIEGTYYTKITSQ